MEFDDGFTRGRSSARTSSYVTASEGWGRNSVGGGSLRSWSSAGSGSYRAPASRVGRFGNMHHY